VPVSPETARVPRRIFSPIAADYDRPAQFLGLFQYRRWHRFLLSRLDLPPGSLVLDMATGTGAMALDLLGHPGLRVVGADITRPMLLRAQRRANIAGVDLNLAECTAEAPPFHDASFDAITSGYLLRYVADVPATLTALVPLLKPGGMMAMLDFAVPTGVWYAPWRVYTDVMLPAAGRLFSQDWHDVGDFLGPSIRNFYKRWPEGALLEAWRDTGFEDVRSRRLSLGGGIVIWGRKAA
jgi:demethylmenaquinone methyltransferase/2-methoxy-6-polyprenyl-1,4-benzoquinol methylase